MQLRGLLLIFAVTFLPSSVGAQNRKPATPNVVLIMTDDAGYGDLGSYGARDIKTPNLDRLARQGVRLTDFYANAATCTPTRAGLITGRYQQRVNLERPLGGRSSWAAEVGLPATGRSLPQLLRNNGYSTALIGKWHLGYKPEFSPNAHGFEYFFGFKSGYTDFYQHSDDTGKPDLWENETPITSTGYMTDLITERSIRYITQNSAKPFFIDIAYNAPHWPYQVPDNPTVARDHARHLGPLDDSTSTRADYAAMLERVDRGVGEIMRTLDRLGISNNTILIFTNDNGGEWLSRNTPLTHNKFSVWEGGIRVPMIARWPGHIPAGTVSSQVGITMDLTRSILAATGTPIPANAKLEGSDILTMLSGRKPVERTLFWRVSNQLTQQAVRQGDWKLLIDGPRMMLFNVRKDPGERTNLIGSRPEIAKKLQPLLTAWQKDVDAEAKADSAK